MRQRRFSKCASDIISPNLSITCRCGSNLMLCTQYLPPNPSLIQEPLLCPSYFCRPSSFGVGRCTHTGVVVIHSHLSTFFCISTNSASAPDSTSSIEFLLQECRNTCIRLWILSIRSARRGGLSQSPCRISAQIGQCDASTFPPRGIVGTLPPGSWL